LKKDINKLFLPWLQSNSSPNSKPNSFQSQVDYPSIKNKLKNETDEEAGLGVLLGTESIVVKELTAAERLFAGCEQVNYRTQTLTLTLTLRVPYKSHTP
jgi:hypothetical protein